MIFKIKFISDEVDGFLRELEIDSEATFFDLNNAILSACQYPDDQMTSFYMCDDEWERHQQITREDMGGGSVDEDFYVMDQTKLYEFIEDEGQKIEFVFDPFSNRTFYLTVRECIPGKSLEQYKIVREKGNPPTQIADLDFSMPTSKATIDTTEDLYGEDLGYDDTEVDLEGFEISDSTEY